MSVYAEERAAHVVIAVLALAALVLVFGGAALLQADIADRARQCEAVGGIYVRQAQAGFACVTPARR